MRNGFNVDFLTSVDSQEIVKIKRMAQDFMKAIFIEKISKFHHSENLQKNYLL